MVSQAAYPTISRISTTGIWCSNPSGRTVRTSSANRPGGSEQRCCSAIRDSAPPPPFDNQKLSHLFEPFESDPDIEAEERQEQKERSGCARTKETSPAPPNSHIMAPVSADPTGDIALAILQALANTDQLLSTEAFPDVPFDTAKAALDRLSSRSMVVYEQIERQEAILEAEAEEIVQHGSHEARVFEAVHKALGGSRFPIWRLRLATRM